MHFGPHFEEVKGGVEPWLTRHILLSDSAHCTVLRAVVLTQYRRVTDGLTVGQTDGLTDGIAVASTAFAKRRAVKIVRCDPHYAVPRIQGDDANRKSLVLGSNCCRRSLTKASTNGVVALNA